jgi:hypothetical protein
MTKLVHYKCKSVDRKLNYSIYDFINTYKSCNSIPQCKYRRYIYREREREQHPILSIKYIIACNGQFGMHLYSLYIVNAMLKNSG